VDVTGWSRAEEAFPHLATLQDAVWRDRKIYLTYGQGDDCTAERLADPLGLVAKGSVWYLVASVGGDVRSYRVSRVRGVRVTDEACERPAGFDLAAHWERASAEFKSKFPRYDATLRVHPELIPRIYLAGRFARVESVGPPGVDGWSEVSMRFQFEWEAAEFALGFGARVEVTEPETLREAVVRQAEGVVAFYARRPPHTS
jgi:predicted DNA-binding transcriptional regulator YafY